MRAIDADALIENKFKNNISYNAFVNLVKRQPTIKPERKKGKWIEIQRSDVNPLTGRRGVYVGCSECGEPIPTDNLLDFIDEADVHFCLNCGADMRGGQDDSISD